jgi:hypothetical protein
MEDVGALKKYSITFTFISMDCFSNIREKVFKKNNSFVDQRFRSILLFGVDSAFYL